MAAGATLRVEPDIVVSVTEPAWTTMLPDGEAMGREAAIAAFLLGSSKARLPQRRVEAALTLANDDALKALNKAYRGRDKATNVLSFPAWTPDDVAMAPEAPILLGDMIVALETTRAEAADLGTRLSDHFRHLVVHAMLHLLGYDHQTDSESKEMERKEVEVLARLGVADPYADAQD